MKTITLDLSVESCTRALRELRRYRDSIGKKMDEVCRRVAEVGAQEAEQIVSQVNFQENNFVDYVGVEKTDNGYKIVMSGEDVYFIEFGTGDGVSAHYDIVSVPVAWGSWSEEHSQMLFNKGFWYYDRVRYTGTPAYMPMYYAEKRMREEMPRIVKEVFGDERI